MQKLETIEQKSLVYLKTSEPRWYDKIRVQMTNLADSSRGFFFFVIKKGQKEGKFLS